LAATSFFFDFQKRPDSGDSSLIQLDRHAGLQLGLLRGDGQFSSFNVGLRKENRVVFSFRLNGIGAFGTEQIGQRAR
jgi:hypothetical protein